MTFGISPGVYPKEVDLTLRASQIATSIGAIVGAFQRGSLDLTFCSSQTRYTKIFGKPQIDYNYAGFSGFYFLDQSNQLWVKRVIGTGAQYGLAFFANDWTSADTWVATSFNNVPSGATAAISSTTTRQVQDVVFSANLVTSNAINMSINTVAIAAVNFTTSSDNTMSLVAAAMQTVIDGLGSGGYARVVEAPSGNDRIIRVISPEGLTLSITGAAVTSGASQATITIRDTDILFWVQSENPGDWANNMLVKIANRNTGYIQRLRLTISAAFVASNSITGTVSDGTDSYTIGPVSYATSSDATLAGVAAAIETAMDNFGAGGTATVTTVSGGSTNDREIIIVAPADNLTNLSFSGMVVTGGVSQPTITVTETNERIAPDGTFDLQLFELPNLNNPVEKWHCSLYDVVDGFGNQIDVEYQVNSGPYKSQNIRVVRNEAYTTRYVVNNLTATTQLLTGGEDGTAPTNAAVIQGWDAFADPEAVTVRILINGGYAVPEVQQKMNMIAVARRDCFAVLDMPNDKQSAQDAANYRTQELNINSSYSAIYTPDVYVYDDNTGKKLYVPPSGMVAAQYAYTDKVRREWFAPAGLNRGNIPRATALRVAYNEGDRDLLSPLQINTIRKMNSSFPIWGDYTLQVAASALQSVPVRRLMITIETALTDAVAFSVFEPNDEPTRSFVRQMCEDFLLPIKNGRGLLDFRVVCDDSNNQPPIVDARELHVDLYLKPTLPALYIQLQSVLVKTGAQFDEIIANSNGGNF